MWQVPRNPRVLSSVVVPGEASESDDEIEELHYHADLPPLRGECLMRLISDQFRVCCRRLRSTAHNLDKRVFRFCT